MAEIWFVRHGESLANAGEKTPETASTPLTPKGHQQARDFSLTLPSCPDLVIVTPYIRTQLTAGPTLERFPSVRVEEWPLHEFTVLSKTAYANKTEQQRVPLMTEYWKRKDPDYVDGPGAECFSGAVARIDESLKRLQAAPESFIVVFTHGRTLQITRFRIEFPSLSQTELMAIIPAYSVQNKIDNCEVIRMTADQNGIRMHESDRRKFAVGLLRTEQAALKSAGILVPA